MSVDVRGKCVTCGRRTKHRDASGWLCVPCEKGGSDAEAQEETEAQAEEADAVLTGEFNGVRYEADSSIPRGEIVFLANKLGAIVRGRVLKGELTLHFPRGPGR